MCAIPRHQGNAKLTLLQDATLPHSEWLSSRNLPWMLERIGRERNFIYGCRRYNFIQPQWTSVWGFPQKLKLELLCAPAVSLQGRNPEISISYHRDIWTSMIVAIVTVANRWDQPFENEVLVCV
jgi:hypothetical protein